MRTALQRLHAAPMLLLTLTTLFWAGNAIAGKLAVGEVRPMQLTFLRWALVSAVLWPLYGPEVRANWAAIRPRFWRIAVMAALGFTGFNMLFYAAAYLTPALNIGILQGAIPVFVLILAFFANGSRITALQGAGVALTLAGVAVVASGGAPGRILEIGVNGGDLMMLAAGVLYAGYTVGLSRRPPVPGRAFFALMALIAAVTALPAALAEAAWRGPALPTADGWAVTLYVAVFPSCLGQLFFLRGVDLIGPGRAGVFVNLVPVFAALLAVALLGERFEPHHGLALALVAGGIWLAQRRGRSPANQTGTPRDPA